MSNRIARKEAIPVIVAFKQMFVESGAKYSHNSQRIFMAWNDVSGASRYTIKRFFRDGKLYITLSSSVVCSQLIMQKDVLIRKINAAVAGDELYIGQEKDGPVKELILR